MNLGRLLATALAAASAIVATTIAPALAQQPAAPPQTMAAGTGLPMWVIRDDDSTIYITGTIHVLPDDVTWMSERLSAALAEATQVWFEIAELGSPEGFAVHVNRVLEEMLAWDGTPLSSMLSEDERVALAAELRIANAPPDIVEKIDRFQPAYAIFAMDRGAMFGGDWREENGVDVVLARMAMQHGAAIRGLETIEFQLEDLNGLDVETQLEELRDRLKPQDAMRAAFGRVANLAFGSWARGETHMVEALEAMMQMSPSEDADALLLDRNENWAGQVEELLKGSGVAFIAVGAMHLVGPDSLQQRLKLRGIETQRY